MKEEPKENWTRVYALVLGFLLLQILVYAYLSNYFA
jgi:hypothetical protein